MKARTIALAGLAILLTARAVAADAVRGTLLRVVVVSRHGVRSPLPGNAELSRWSPDPWPSWPVKPGELTSRGEQLETLLGAYYRAWLSSEDLLPAAGCPGKGATFVWTDTDQRTKKTGQGLLEGLAPGCGLEAHWTTAASDPIFRSMTPKGCPVDEKTARAAINGRAGDDLEALVQADRDSLDAVQSVLHCCGQSSAGAAAANLLEEAPHIERRASDGAPWMEGGLGLASTASEIFLLEYAQGFPDAQVGWGRADPARILAGLRLHTLTFDLMFRTPYLASRGGSLLMRRVIGAVDSHQRAGSAPDVAPRSAKFVAYIGHDTNVANLAAMLDASWEIPGYQPNYTVPGGALVFELRRAAGGALTVYTSYVAQMLPQLRQMETLSLKNPPGRSPLFIPACSSAAPGYPCGLAAFVRAAQKTIAPDCPVRPDAPTAQ